MMQAEALMQKSTKKLIECRDIPTEKTCSLTFSGEEEEVLNAAVQHVVSVHGFRRTPELRERLRELLKDEEEARVLNI